MRHARSRRSRPAGRGHAVRSGLLAGMLAALAHQAPGHAADLEDLAREDHLRAGYVFNFAKFVEWPAFNPADDLTVCFAGAPGVRDAFSTFFAGKQIGTHRVALRTLGGRDSAAGCHIVYVAVGSADGLRPPGTDSPGVLTVGDERDFIHRGGIVELYPDNNRLRFNINLELARRAGLKISSSLLQLASHVEETAP